MKFDILNTTGKSTTLSVSDDVFAGKVNKPLMAQAVRVYLSNQRQGTSKVKTRGEVNRTKKKWFKQKGTGNARHGARSANIFVGGGVSHGPTGTQNWSLRMPQQMKKKALMSALALQAENIVVTTVLDGIKPKTKDAVAYLEKLAPDARRILIVLDKHAENLTRSTSNLANVLVTTAQRLHIYETLLADKIIFTKEAVKMLEERLAGEVKEPKSEKEVVVKEEVKKEPKVEKKVAVKKEKVVKKAKKKE